MRVTTGVLKAAGVVLVSAAALIELSSRLPTVTGLHAGWVVFTNLLPIPTIVLLVEGVQRLMSKRGAAAEDFELDPAHVALMLSSMRAREWQRTMLYTSSAGDVSPSDIILNASFEAATMGIEGVYLINEQELRQSPKNDKTLDIKFDPERQVRFVHAFERAQA